ncbi:MULTISPECIES: hypothetical protein [Campylobacter]|uniref:Helicase n=1 Tax=Campylobacter porcelli TaxID=1660073 RepID=A0A1X9SUK3_9BACT|nr:MULTISPECIES: hypothetical protein [unclassified Campylobacter]MCR8679772.1 hypothetical protein [Campylobacter sp. RM19072]MEE3705510.1 hypothetical protein [Campylobacter sp. CX2-8023-23]MEE3745221.1 hypothetical protein [Campylobacter sp. CX2-4855-23]MEE3777434.1 hypothetical protein [Campylobacter sp. CX2-4080-23]ARQ99916.1 hypothetical protein CSUIS_0060 [Campylobacter sp. RM6137]
MNQINETKKPKITLETKREIAKIGMSSTLLLTATTALFMKNKTAKSIHIVSGVALVGFCLYHASLYPKVK